MHFYFLRTKTHLASLSFALLNPYANAGVGCIHIDDAPAIVAVVVATLSINPRRVDVIISSSFDMDSKDLTDAHRSGCETKECEGDAMKMVAIAADRKREDLVMVDVCFVVMNEDGFLFFLLILFSDSIL